MKTLRVTGKNVRVTGKNVRVSGKNVRVTGKNGRVTTGRNSYTTIHYYNLHHVRALCPCILRSRFRSVFIFSGKTIYSTILYRIPIEKVK